MTATFGDAHLPDRFWEKVQPEPNSGCWLWAAYVDQAGYGRFRLDGESRYAHRVAFEAFVGPIPAGLDSDHLCRVRSCCNPEHLDAVTRYENRIRGEQGGFGQLRTHCRNGHERTPENARITHGGYRICRTCDNEASRLRMRALKHRRRLAATGGA